MSNSTTTRDPLLRMEDVSEQTGVPINTLRYWRNRKQGEGPKSARLGRRVVYLQSDVDEWVKAQLAKAS